MGAYASSLKVNSQIEEQGAQILSSNILVLCHVCFIIAIVEDRSRPNGKLGFRWENEEMTRREGRDIWRKRLRMWSVPSPQQVFLLIPTRLH